MSFSKVISAIWWPNSGTFFESSYYGAWKVGEFDAKNIAINIGIKRIKLGELANSGTHHMLGLQLQKVPGDGMYSIHPKYYLGI